ncbi:unnamed protein product, partial [Staurois parvus]
DCPISNILLQGGTCAQNHIYIHVILHLRVKTASPFGAADVNHRVLVGNYLLAPCDYRASLTGRKIVLFTIFLPVSSSTLLGMAMHSTAIPISVLTVKNTPPPPSKTPTAHS